MVILDDTKYVVHHRIRHRYTTMSVCVCADLFFRDPKSNVFKKTSCKIFVYFVGSGL